MLSIIFISSAAFAKVAVGWEAASKYFVSDQKLFASEPYVAGLFSVQFENHQKSLGGVQFTIGEVWRFVDFVTRFSRDPESETSSLGFGIEIPRAEEGFPLYIGGQTGFRVEEARSAFLPEVLGYFGWRRFRAIWFLGIFAQLEYVRLTSLKTEESFLTVGGIVRF